MDIQGMITELCEERACLDEALPAVARTTHGSGKRRLKKLARPLIAGAADDVTVPGALPRPRSPRFKCTSMGMRRAARAVRQESRIIRSFESFFAPSHDSE